MFLGARRRFTFVNVVMTFVLVFAMSGGAFAARKYLITSTKQISPKVLKSLAGKPGPAGPVGPGGSVGVAGAQGPVGSPGKDGLPGKQGEPGKDGKDGATGFTEVLPVGKTLRGDWSLSQLAASETFVSTGVSFGIPLAGAPVPRLVKADGKELVVKGSAVEEVTPTNCLGSSAEPKASPGNLCVYVHLEKGVVQTAGTPFPAICSLGAGTGVFTCAVGGVLLEKWGADRSGFGLGALIQAGAVEDEGTWAVTAE
jgi:hypothetical protein